MNCKCTTRGKKPNWKMIIPKEGGILQRSRRGGITAAKRCVNCGTEMTVSETNRTR